MNNIIIGTAGHIDHGKTSLIKALTGRNTDRWEEEKRRGITIDLGFTYFDLQSGDRVGIIDVPGHEKFINNMVAGVVGMDLVMLIISAEEGIMPQTQEHLAILSQLGIKNSIVVLNKCDLVEDDWLELMKEEVGNSLEETFMKNAPMCCVSAATGEGIEGLKSVIEKLTQNQVEPKDVQTIPRLPIDRSFSIKGFGTVVTGTLVSGKITKDTILQMYPNDKDCKIRSIQVHGETVEECIAGQRVAINVSNVKKEEASRGHILAPVGSMKETKLLDVKLEVIKNSTRVLTNHTRLHLFTGTSEILCRAVLLDKDEIKPGESGFVQLRLEEPIALRRGDRFVVRFYSPMETIGGGVILEPNPVKHKRFKEDILEQLKCKEAGDTKDVCEMHIKTYEKTMITAQELAKLTAMNTEEVEKDFFDLEQEGLVKLYKTKKELYAWHTATYEEITRKIEKYLSCYHKENPYKWGVNKAQIHMEFLKNVKVNVFDLYIENLINTKKFTKKNEFLQYEFDINRDERFQMTRETILDTLVKAKFDFIKLSTIDMEIELLKDVVEVLLHDKEIVKITEDLYTTNSYIEEAVEMIKNVLDEEGIITVIQVRDLLNTSRKSAKPILEYLDTIKITKRGNVESERVAFK